MAKDLRQTLKEAAEMLHKKGKDGSSTSMSKDASYKPLEESKSLHED